MHKYLKIIIGIILLAAAFLFIYFFLNKPAGEEEILEYNPAEEISDDQMRNTIITLYFKDKESGNLVKETRLIDAKLLLGNTYDILTNLLITGPKGEQLEGIFKEGTKLNKSELVGDVLYLDFSKELSEMITENESYRDLIKMALFNTLTELTEINDVKISVDGIEIS